MRSSLVNGSSVSIKNCEEFAWDTLFSICIDRTKPTDYNEIVIKAAVNDDFSAFTAGQGERNDWSATRSEGIEQAV